MNSTHPYFPQCHNHNQYRNRGGVSYILIHSNGGGATVHPYSWQWRCFYILINPSGGVASSLFTPMELLLNPYLPQWRCCYILIHPNDGLSTLLFTPMEVFLYFCLSQWRCFYFLIHPNQAVSTFSFTPMEVFLHAYSLR